MAVLRISSIGGVNKALLENVLKGILRDAKPSVIPPNPRATRRCARKKGGTGLKVPLKKGDFEGDRVFGYS
jgi:hypothetical protein